MTEIYGEQHRQMQDQFDSRQLADRLADTIVKTALGHQDAEFIGSRDMFFLSSIDHLQRPTVSYKGGDPGFVHIVDDKTLAFPSYDGNGMFLSMGNIASNPQVGLLFIDFIKPQRLRLQGQASVSADDPLLQHFHGAEMIVRVAIDQLWTNCPRYVHRYAAVDASPYVPRPTTETPLAPWKRLEFVQDVLPAKDADSVAQAGGILSPQDYADLLAKTLPASSLD
jgi:hypothetical protein